MIRFLPGPPWNCSLGYAYTFFQIQLLGDTYVELLEYRIRQVCITPTPLRRFSKVDCSTAKRMHQYRTIRLRKALGEVFSTTTFFLAPVLFQPGLCDIHHRIRYASMARVPCLQHQPTRRFFFFFFEYPPADG